MASPVGSSGSGGSIRRGGPPHALILCLVLNLSLLARAISGQAPLPLGEDKKEGERLVQREKELPRLSEGKGGLEQLSEREEEIPRLSDREETPLQLREREKELVVVSENEGKGQFGLLGEREPLAAAGRLLPFSETESELQMHLGGGLSEPNSGRRRMHGNQLKHWDPLPEGARGLGQLSSFLREDRELLIRGGTGLLEPTRPLPERDTAPQWERRAEVAELRGTMLEEGGERVSKAFRVDEAARMQENKGEMDQKKIGGADLPVLERIGAHAEAEDAPLILLPMPGVHRRLL
eukprot:scaffold129930_cov34-Tisochrysis_lutea.AAC.2